MLAAYGEWSSMGLLYFSTGIELISIVDVVSGYPPALLFPALWAGRGYQMVALHL